MPFAKRILFLLALFLDYIPVDDSRKYLRFSYVNARKPNRAYSYSASTFGIGIVWAIFLFCYLTEFAFVKSRDDLFIEYDKEGEPYSVEVSKKRVRALYRNLLYIIKGKKIKTIKSERKLYYAYLNMFPQCVLDMGKYVDNSDRSTEAVFIPDINYCEDGQCILSLGKPAYKQNQNLPAGFEGFCPKSLLRHLNFYNYIFTVDNELQIISVYSAARQNAVIGYNVVTFAQRSEGGDAAKQALRNIAAKNKLLGNILYKIDN